MIFFIISIATIFMLQGFLPLLCPGISNPTVLSDVTQSTNRVSCHGKIIYPDRGIQANVPSNSLQALGSLLKLYNGTDVSGLFPSYGQFYPDSAYATDVSKCVDKVSSIAWLTKLTHQTSINVNFTAGSIDNCFAQTRYGDQPSHSCFSSSQFYSDLSSMSGSGKFMIDHQIFTHLEKIQFSQILFFYFFSRHFYISKYDFKKCHS